MLEFQLLLPVEWVRLGLYPFLVSKAFTRESDENEGEEIPSGRVQLPPGAKNYITREGADRLRQSLNELLEKRRAGANQGNNADPEAKAEQRRIESAIRKLQLILDSVIVAEPPADCGKVSFGASVRIRYQDGEEETYQIVELSRCAAMVFDHLGVYCQAASRWKPTTMAVHEKHQIFIHRQSQPSPAQRSRDYSWRSREQVGPQACYSYRHSHNRSGLRQSCRL